MPQQILQVSSDAAFQVQYRPRMEYKFLMRAPYAVQTDINCGHLAGNEFVRINPTGLLMMAEGYAWNGASGPAIDTVDFVRGSGAHDAVYQLIREGHLGMEHRKAADELLHRIVLEDNMWKIRANWVYLGVRIGGRYYTRSN